MSLKIIFRPKGSDCVSLQQPKPLRNINPIRLQEENNEFESKRLTQARSFNERSEKGERSGEERNLKVIVVIVHVEVFDCVTFRPRLLKRWIALSTG